MTYNLYPHQEMMVEWMSERRAKGLDYGGIFAETGTGKSLTVLDFAMSQGFKRILVLSPPSSLDATWRQEVDRFTYYNPITLSGPVKKRIETLRDIYTHENVVVATNYEALINPQFLGALCNSKFDVVFADESTFFKNPKIRKSKRTKAMYELAKYIPCRYAMSGTPAPNGMQDYFSQMRFLSPDILGDNYYKFETEYFYKSGFQGYELNITPENEKKMLEKIREHSVTVRKQDVLKDLPDNTNIIMHYHLTAKEEKAYNQMKKDFLIPFESGDVTAGQAATQLLKLRQVTSSFIYDEDKSVVKIEKKMGKIAVLDEIRDKVGKDEKIIVWVSFRHEGETIAKHLGTQYFSDMSEKKRNETLDEFQNGSLKYLVAHPKSLGYSVTLTSCNTNVYFSIDYDHLVHSQSIARVYRNGQKRKTFNYFILGKDTVDEAVYNTLQGKGDAADFMAEFLKC